MIKPLSFRLDDKYFWGTFNKEETAKSWFRGDKAENEVRPFGVEILCVNEHGEIEWKREKGWSVWGTWKENESEFHKAVELP